MHQGTACYLLERYEEAQAALLEGLALEPSNQQLQQALTLVRQAAGAPSTSSPAAAVQPATST
jgi:hypothetical protein